MNNWKIRKTKTYNNLDVTVLDVADHMRIPTDEDGDKTYIEDTIQDAYEYAEGFIDKDILPTVNTYTEYSFSGQYIYIEEGNFISATTITYTDDSVSKSIAVSGCTIEDNDRKISIKLPSSLTDVDKIVVVFRSGMSTPIPKKLQRAIKVIAADMYHSERSSYNTNYIIRGDVTERLLRSFKKY